MFATILTYLSLAYSFDLAYEQTNWVLWDCTKPTYKSMSNDYLGFKADLELRAGLQSLYGFVGGQMYNSSRIEDVKQGPGGFNPVMDDYQFRAGVRAKSSASLCVELGWEYHCVHPIKTYMIEDFAKPWSKEGAYSNFHITVSGTIGGKKR